MKGKVFTALVFGLFCLFVFTGCPFVSSLEKDLQVVIREGSDVNVYTVNQFNNAVVPEAQAPSGKVFVGWTTVGDWESMAQEEIPLVKNKGLIRYDDVKDYVKEGARSVEVYPVFADVPKRDLVVAWYNKTSTSGIDQSNVDAFMTKLAAFLDANGHKNADILARGYEGNVADSLASIKKDGDVDILIGWSTTSNITSTGGWVENEDFKENVGDITIGSKARYSARITDSEITKLVYGWIQSEFGTETVAEAPATQVEAPKSEPAPAEAPKTDATPVDSSKLVIGWYAKTGTSGLDESIMAKVERAVNAFLKGKGISAEVTLKAYDGVVADVEAAVVSDADVNLMVGMKAFAPAGYEMQVIQDLAMGDKTGRRIHLLQANDAATAVFEWFSTEEAQAKLLPGAEKEPLVIGWYAKTATSGVDEEIIAKLSAALDAFLAENGLEAEVTFKPYDGVVADVEAAVIADANVDLMVGMKAFAPAGYEMEVIQDLAMGDKTGRRIHRLSRTELSGIVFEWLGTAEAQANLVK